MFTTDPTLLRMLVAERQDQLRRDAMRPMWRPAARRRWPRLRRRPHLVAVPAMD